MSNSNSFKSQLNDKSNTKRRFTNDRSRNDSNSRFKKRFNRHERSESSDRKDRIAKRLSMIGIASRRDAEKLVIDGKVRINGIECKDLSFMVGYDDRISVNGKEIVNKPIRTKIFLMNKPAGCVTTNNDPQGRKTIFELIPSKFGRLMSVGRLDMNTEGIILLTNNGELARLLEMPATALKRVYFAKVVGDINEKTLSSLKDLRKGIKIEGVEYGKMIVDVENNDKVKAVLRIVIFEGKNNEIRRIMWHFGLKVVKLMRVQYGTFKLCGLPSGCVKESHFKLNIRELERRAYENIKRYNAKKGQKDKTEEDEDVEETTIGCTTDTTDTEDYTRKDDVNNVKNVDKKDKSDSKNKATKIDGKIIKNTKNTISSEKTKTISKQNSDVK